MALCVMPHETEPPVPLATAPDPVRRCRNCGRKLARVWLAPGSVVEIKCRCNVVCVIEAPPIDKQSGGM